MCEYVGINGYWLNWYMVWYDSWTKSLKSLTYRYLHKIRSFNCCVVMSDNIALHIGEIMKDHSVNLIQKCAFNPCICCSPHDLTQKFHNSYFLIRCQNNLLHFVYTALANLDYNYGVFRKFFNIFKSIKKNSNVVVRRKHCRT